MSRQTPIRWGILGAAKIARLSVGPAIIAADRSELVSVASRDHEHARTMARELGVARTHIDYSDLLADPEIDAVYIPLPNSLHCDWTVAALEAGKHVLCEKPLALTLSEVDRVIDAATLTGRIAMEAFMWRTMPRIQHAIGLVRAGAIGQVRVVRTSFTSMSRGFGKGKIADNIRLHPELGGGALTDLGCYGIDAIREFVRPDTPVVEVAAASVRHEGTAVDTTTTASIRFENGAVGQLLASMESPPDNVVEILGDAGRIRLASAFRTFDDSPTSLVLESADETRTLSFGGQDPFRLEIEHMAGRIIDGDAPLLTLTESRTNAEILDAVRRAAMEAL